MSKPLRILTIGHSYCVALNRAVFREMSGDPDLQITLAAPRYFHGDLRPIDIEPEPPGSKLRIVPLGTKRSRFIHVFGYNATELRSLIQEGTFDVVHAWEEPYIFAGYQIARSVSRTSSRFCFWTAQNIVKRYPPPFRNFEKNVLNRADGWIAQASLVYETMIARGYPKEAGSTITLAVDTKAFRPPTREARAEVLRELGLQPPVIGFVGRLTEAKGLDILMQAIEQLRADQPWSLLLLGSGEHKEKIQAWASRHGFRDRVKILLAKHSDVPRYLGCMDLLVAPSQTRKNWREQFGRMLVEAFASGVPVIGSDSGEIPYVIGDAGRVVEEQNVSGWTRAIEDLLNNPSARGALQQRGLARAHVYSVAAVAEQYRRYFLRLAGQKAEAAELTRQGARTS